MSFKTHLLYDGAQLEFKDKPQIALGCKMMKNGRLLAHFQTALHFSVGLILFTAFFVFFLTFFFSLSQMF